jgi:hypothetical protein
MSSCIAVSSQLWEWERGLPIFADFFILLSDWSHDALRLLAIKSIMSWGLLNLWYLMSCHTSGRSFWGVFRKSLDLRVWCQWSLWLYQLHRQNSKGVALSVSVILKSAWLLNLFSIWAIINITGSWKSKGSTFIWKWWCFLIQAANISIAMGRYGGHIFS